MFWQRVLRITTTGIFHSWAFPLKHGFLYSTARCDANSLYWQDVWTGSVGFHNLLPKHPNILLHVISLHCDQLNKLCVLHVNMFVHKKISAIYSFFLVYFYVCCRFINDRSLLQCYQTFWNIHTCWNFILCFMLSIKV